MIVGFGKNIGVGKTTAARFAIEEFDGIRIAFGDALKEEAYNFVRSSGFFVEQSLFWGTQSDKEHLLRLRDSYCLSLLPCGLEDFCSYYDSGVYYITIRKFLQFWGTEFRRAQNPYYWIIKLAQRLKSNTNIFIDDVREIHEIQFIQSLGGKVILIERETPYSDSHCSEFPLPTILYDSNILNTKTLTEFKSNVLSTIRGLYV